jgi:hypothetical protein
VKYRTHSQRHVPEVIPLPVGLVEQVRAEPPTWRYTPLGEELGIELFEVFMELFDGSDVPFFREEYVLPSKSECTNKKPSI